LSSVPQINEIALGVDVEWDLDDATRHDVSEIRDAIVIFDYTVGPFYNTEQQRDEAVFWDLLPFVRFPHKYW